MMVIAVTFSEDIARWILQDSRYGPQVVLTAGATAFSCLSIPFRQYLMFVNRPIAYVWISSLSRAPPFA